MKFYKDNFCHCGCNKLIPYNDNHKYKRIPLYIQGHGSRKQSIPKKELIILENGILVYDNHYCECSCHKRIPWANWHIWNSIPKFIKGHNSIKNFEIRKNVFNAEKTIKNSIEVYKDYYCKCGCKNNIPFNKRHTETGIPDYIVGHSSTKTYHIPKTIIYNGIKIYKDYYCKCGCGNRIIFKETHKYIGIPEFINGHQSKGELNPNWNNGSSFLPYCFKFNKSFKESIRQRDNYTCQLCGKTQEENGRKLDVHHIHHDKTNCYPDCIALCRKCNVGTVEIKETMKYYEDIFMNNLNNRGLLFWSKRIL